MAANDRFAGWQWAAGSGNSQCRSIKGGASIIMIKITTAMPGTRDVDR
jgi:hypothetical protein